MITLKAAGKLKVAVVGDVMVDQYQTCVITGTSPEDELAPKLRPLWVPEVHPGGAANVGRCAAAWDASVTVHGVVGDDEEGQMLSQRYPHLLIATDRCTTNKLRYVTKKGRQICRIDREVQEPISRELQNRILDELKKIKPDVLIMSDYAKGVLLDPVFCQTLSADHVGIPVLVDPKGDNFSKYGMVTAITPNESEFKIVKDVRNGTVYLRDCLAESIVETRGNEGAFRWQRLHGSRESWTVSGHVGCVARDVGDPSGCGDAYIAALAVCIAHDYPFELAMRYASAAGALTFDHRGVYAPHRDEIEVEVKRDGYRYEITPHGNV